MLAESSLLTLLCLTQYTGIDTDNSYIDTETMISQSIEDSEYIDSLIFANSIQSCASITVLVHGLGSSYEDFLGPGRYVDRTIASYLQHAEYRFDAITDEVLPFEDNAYLLSSDFSFYKLTPNPVRGSFNRNLIDINEINIDQSIVLFYNELVAGYNLNLLSVSNSLFEISLNSVISEVAKKQGDVLPKINLIGHSRGGLTICDYATKYPAIVNSLFTLGSPLGNMTYAPHLVNLGLNINSNEGDPYISSQEYNCYCELFDNENKYNKCLQFNSISHNFYSRNFVFYQTSSFLYNGLMNMYLDDISNGNSSFFVNFFYNNYESILDYLLSHDHSGLVAFLSPLITSSYPALSPYINDLIAILDFLSDDSENSSFDGLYFKFDSLVNEGSAKGICYSEIHPIPVSYYFNAQSYITVGSSLFGDSYNDNSINIDDYVGRPDDIRIAHNFETKSRMAAGIILSDLNLHGGFHQHMFVRSYDDVSHYFHCACGAYKDVEEHSFLYNFDAINHTISCQSPFCSYSLTEQHNMRFVNNETTHTHLCSACNYVEYTETHNLSLCLSIGSQGHKYMCVCGYSSGFEPHVYALRKCIYCGYQRGGGTIGPYYPGGSL